MIYAVPEIKSDALTRAYVAEILVRQTEFSGVAVAVQTPIDDVTSGVPTVKVAGRVT